MTIGVRKLTLISNAEKRNPNPLVLPISAVVEAMGGEVGWDSGEKKSTLEANGNTVVMWIGNIEYTVNGATNEMDIAPFIENERTFLPLRFATANLNCRVTWISDTKEILIVYNSGENETSVPCLASLSRFIHING